MREIYKEADLVSAEVHQILHDGVRHEAPPSVTKRVTTRPKLEPSPALAPHARGAGRRALAPHPLRQVRSARARSTRRGCRPAPERLAVAMSRRNCRAAEGWVEGADAPPTRSSCFGRRYPTS
jgi:hypothetical protein